ncbi:MAG TPA: dihydroorotate dehydrogenase, partial [Bacilli bacterium]|nr:dihydroorotate dehydrogenase [Bacilli bacterium]
DAEEAAAERVRVMERLAADAAFFALDTTEMIAQGGWQKEAWERHLETVARAAREQRIGKPLVLCVAPDMETEMLHRLVAPALRLGVQGVMVTGGVEATVRQALADAIDCETVQASEKQVEGERQTNQEPQPQELRTSTRARLIGLPTREATLNTVREIRARYGTDCPILASGGVHEPQDALELMAAGADLVLVDSGLVYSGPGLPKRINEAIEWQQERNEQREPLLLKKPEPTRNKPSTLRSSQAPTPRTFFQKSGWFWIQWLGLGMIVGGILAWLIAATVVVLPYDVEFLRLGREGIAAINERLLYFMAHDRISLAGTMISIGVLYFGLARYAMRRGEQWARTTVLASAAVGFASFFLYLGYGYFDPLHAAVALLLLPLFLLGLVKNNPRAPRPAPNLRNTAVWKRSLVGQLLFVSFGAGLLLSGLVISGVGVTDVFVQEDLNYLCTTSNSLQAANPNLVPLIAHDRAGFGGALVSDGIAYLLLSLWGFRQGEKWLWWTLLFGGFAGFFAVFSTHWYVGYLDQWHLAPAYLALLLYGAGLILTYPFLTRPRR